MVIETIELITNMIPVKNSMNNNRIIGDIKVSTNPPIIKMKAKHNCHIPDNIPVAVYLNTPNIKAGKNNNNVNAIFIINS